MNDTNTIRFSVGAHVSAEHEGYDAMATRHAAHSDELSDRAYGAGVSAGANVDFGRISLQLDGAYTAAYRSGAAYSDIYGYQHIGRSEDDGTYSYLEHTGSLGAHMRHEINRFGDGPNPVQLSYLIGAEYRGTSHYDHTDQVITNNSATYDILPHDVVDAAYRAQEIKQLRNNEVAVAIGVGLQQRVWGVDLLASAAVPTQTPHNSMLVGGRAVLRIGSAADPVQAHARIDVHSHLYSAPRVGNESTFTEGLSIKVDSGFDWHVSENATLGAHIHISTAHAARDAATFCKSATNCATVSAITAGGTSFGGAIEYTQHFAW